MCNNDDDFSTFEREEVYESNQYNPFQQFQQQAEHEQLFFDNLFHNLETREKNKIQQISDEPSSPHFLTKNQEYLSQNHTYKYQKIHRLDEEQGYLLREKKEKQKLKVIADTMFPGESKNLSKCYARYLQQFIIEVCNKAEDSELNKLIHDEDIQKFLSKKAENLTNFDLSEFIESPKGSIFAKEFFGNCLWNQSVVKESKTNVAVLYRHNIEQFSKVIKNPKITE